ncbi:MAG TPA: hypothetical protein VFS83_14700, partial [Ktedonobacterales bacterium]|nr:hypothetical protein [Ktedonobacterales bacterium]
MPPSVPSPSPDTAPPASAMPVPNGWRAARYRVWQFWRSLLPRPLDADDQAILAAYLSPEGRALFATMSRNDQRHSLT